MHVCVHLHTRACILIHSGTGTGMYVHHVLLEVLTWRPFCLLSSNLSELHTLYCILPLHIAHCTLRATGVVCCRFQDNKCLVVLFTVHGVEGGSNPVLT